MWNQCKDQKNIKESKGLFVNEALTSTSGKDYVKKAIEAMIVKTNTNKDGEIRNPILIFAGYPCEMEDFLRMNPGLLRWIPNFLQFNDYTPMVLAEITNKILHAHGKVKGLDFDCSIQNIDRFKKEDVELGIGCFLCNKWSGDQTFSGQGAMTTTLSYVMDPDSRGHYENTWCRGRVFQFRIIFSLSTKATTIIRKIFETSSSCSSFLYQMTGG